MNKKILFLSKDNLTTNPRLKKELLLALEKGYKVTFIGFDSDNWSNEIEKKYSKLSAKLIYLPAVRKKGFFIWFISTLAEKISLILYPWFKNSIIINALAHSKRTFTLLAYLYKHKEKYDFISAHTLPTLYVAFKLSKKTKTPFAFDIEDYHPGEKITNKNPIQEKNRRKFLLKKLLPMACLITYASPLIGYYTLRLTNTSKFPPHTFISNSFPSSLFSYKENNEEKIHFVWFSQNIAAGRGLELFLEAASEFKDKIKVTLIGNLYEKFHQQTLKKYSEFINILPPMPEEKLYSELCKFDIGLALENKNADFNRNICLTNKIYAYAQSGLYIFATDTEGQKKFINENKNSGIIVNNNKSEIQKQLKNIIENIQAIRENKKNRFEHGKKLSWDYEKNKIFSLWLSNCKK